MSLSDKVTQFNTDADLAHQVFHGDATTVVQTEGGPVRSLAKLLADNQATLDAQVSLRDDLAANTGAGLVKTTDGSTVQQQLDALAASAGSGTVKSVNATAPDGSGNVTLTTDNISEGGAAGGNLWFNATRVLNTVLTGFSTATNAVVTAADTVLAAIGKLQKQISDLLAAKDASSGYVGLTLFKINFRNAANTFTSFLTNANTAARTYLFPDKDGTVAMLSDIPSASSGPLASITVSSAVANIDFLNIFTSAYDKYVIEIQAAKPSASDILAMQMAKSGVVDSTSNYAGLITYAGSTTGGAKFIWPNPAGTVEGSHTVEVLNANDATLFKTVTVRGMIRAMAASSVVTHGGAYFGANTVSGFRLFWNSGANFIGGTVRVYGIKNS